MIIKSIEDPLTVTKRWIAPGINYQINLRDIKYNYEELSVVISSQDGIT